MILALISSFPSTCYKPPPHKKLRPNNCSKIQLSPAYKAFHIQANSLTLCLPNAQLSAELQAHNAYAIAYVF